MRAIATFICCFFLAFMAYAQTNVDVETIRAEYNNEEYKSIIKKYANSSEILEAKVIYYIGMSYFMLEDDENALKYLSSAIEKGPVDFDMYYYKGMTQYYMKRYGDALVNINKAIELLPDEPDFYFGKSKVYIDMGKTDSAIINLELAFEIDSSNIDVLDELGFQYSQIKNYVKAERVYKCLMQFEDKDSEGYKVAWYNVGLSQLLSHQGSKAEQTFKSYLIKFPEDYQVIAKLIQALYSQQKYAETLDYKKQLYALHKKNKLPEIMKEMYAFDQFFWNDKLIMSYEFFDEINEGLITIKYRFYVTDNNGNVEYYIQAESSSAVRMTNGKYILALIKNNNHYSYWSYIFDDDFDYSILKENLIQILNGDLKPDASTIRN